ncbi:unnamed protein product [Lupinus luteus]|uniref:Inositol hexakisphosphate and diphosphoinositol-pentakisphosphate kinase n=1 Tax=Lupinus luteus TaxID=3873 RepID=A0AAV1VPU1_LUPLU
MEWITIKLSPIVTHVTIRVLLSLVVSHHWMIEQLDINNAFLNGFLDEEVYMTQPLGFHQHDKTLICKLHKVIYGLKQAPRQWFERLKGSLLKLGLQVNKCDNPLFIHTSLPYKIYVLVYVDDIIVTESSSSHVQKLIKDLNSTFALEKLGPLDYSLGIEVKHKKDGTLFLSQSKYIRDLLEKAHLTSTKALPTPMARTANLQSMELISLKILSFIGEGTGLLRLHSTYRHDLKIYSSDEGRVQMSAAAFAKGLLDLEGQLTPIQVSLVSKDSSMLDGLEDASTEMKEAKARLNAIITSTAKTADSNGSPEFPWMVDGAGLPPNASELLPKLVKLTKKVTEQVRILAKDENDKLTERSLYDVIPPYDQAKALGKTNIDVDRIAAGLPCGSEGFLLMYARWKKLERDLYNERKERFDITQIPDVYDSCKYDLLHNAHLNLDGLDELFEVAQALADGVIPNEYGINPKQRLKIGSKITRRLLGKLLIDLRNTREEAISVAELKNNQDHSLSMKTEKEDSEAKLKHFHKNDELRKCNTTSDISSMDQDDDDDRETKYRLDPKYANVKTPDRHVRTRLYFTSESHIHSLMNVLRYCNLDESLQGEESLVCHNALERLCKTRELDYMSYIVLRMFENTEVALEDPKRYRIELTFSRGADLSPLEVSISDNDSEGSSLRQEHTLPIMGPERLQEIGSYLTLERMEKMIRPFAMPAEDFPPSTPAGFSGYFSSKSMLERLVNLWPFHKQAHYAK